MPWDAESFKKHWKGATHAQLAEAAAQATAMLKGGADEGVAIATAIKHAKKKHKKTLGEHLYGGKK